MILDGNERDPISPVSIVHGIDEIWADDERSDLEQRYNFLDYHFERNGRYCRARAYLDEPQKVTVYGPFAQREQLRSIIDPEFAAEVKFYLERRFQALDWFEVR